MDKTWNAQILTKKKMLPFFQDEIREREISMSSTNIYHDSASETLHWNPAKECLFGVLIVIIALIAVLLLKFSCSKHQSETNPPPSYHPERPELQAEKKLENYDVNASDEVFVIMAGEQKPSFLAKPVASTALQPCEQV